MALGAALMAISVAALLLATQPVSRVARRLELVAPARPRSAPHWRVMPDIQLRHAGFDLGPERLLAVKLVAALVAASCGALASLVVPMGPLPIGVAAYAGFVAPSMVIDRRAANARERAAREVGVLAERLESLVAAGRPPETALAAIVARPTGAEILDGVLARAREAYALGAPLFRTLAATARDEGLTACARLADDLERARDLGTGAAPVIREMRSSLRAAERARRLEAAAKVEGKLMLILVLCYLPALILLVVIPLFVGLLDGLLG